MADTSTNNNTGLTSLIFPPEQPWKSFVSAMITNLRRKQNLKTPEHMYYTSISITFYVFLYRYDGAIRINYNIE